MAEDEESRFSAQHRLIAELGRHPLAEGATRGQRSCLRLCEPIATGRYRLRLLSQFGRTDALLFQESGLTFHLIRSLRRETDCFLPRSLRNVFQFVVDIRLIYPLG